MIGIPGSGKSVFAATLINHLQQEDVPTLYFFFRQIIDANHSPVAALRDWLDQILTFSPPLQLILKEYVDSRRSLESLSTTDLWRHLRTALSHHPRAYIVVDALDEMDQGHNMDAFLHSLADLGHWRPSQLKIIVTSRPVQSIERSLRKAKAQQIRLEEWLVDVDVDIATYTEHRLAQSSILTKDHLIIKGAVPGRANGLFLYAKLAMDAFVQPGADIQQVLHDLPADLNVMYTDLLREHARKTGIDPDIQLLIMQFVTHATRPLRLLELSQMVNITHLPAEKRDLKATKNLVRSACGPLLEILPNETVCIIHHSLAEFLTGGTRSAGSHDYPILNFGRTHSRLALACLSHLQSTGLDEVQLDGDSLRPKYVCGVGMLSPFTEYAGSNWFIHAGKAAASGVDPSEIHKILDILFDGSNLERLGALSKLDVLGSSATPLFTAVALGLVDYTRVLLSRPGTEINKGQALQLSPLAYAAKRGYDEIAELLLQHGADPMDRDRSAFSDATPLHHAAFHNHPKIVSMLLKAGVDPLVRKTRSNPSELCRTTQYAALEYACKNGHVEAATAFFPFLKTAQTANAALCWAAEGGQSAVVELLLNHPLVQVNEKVFDTPPLLSVCGHRDVRSVRCLLAAGADPNLRHREPWPPLPPNSDRGYAALHCWAARTKYPGHLNSVGHPCDVAATEECFQLLIGAGADIHQRDPGGNTPLHLAKDTLAARLLVDTGADPNALNDRGETPLHHCRDKAIVQFLLEESKASTNTKTGDAPLLTFIKTGHIENALMLLEFGADATVLDRDGNNAFHYAVGLNKPHQGSDLRRQLIEALSTAGANVNLKNKQGETPMHLFGIGLRVFGLRGVDDIIFSAMVAAGADVEVKNNEGQTALFVKVQRGLGANSDIDTLCKMMAAAGARLDTRDYKGRTLLHAAVDDSNTGCLRWLADHGVDCRVTDHDGNTVFHDAMMRANRWPYGQQSRSFGKFDELIAVGIDPLQPNNTGRTPLHSISATRPCLDNSGNTLQWKTTAFDYVLAFYDDVNCPDNTGVTPLHLAATFSEYQTRRLLEAGADPSKATHEGMTAFHLAARGRQPNIIGRLLDALESCVGRNGMKQILDAEANSLKTALHYACASGVVESVKLLLDAGASADGDQLKMALDGCVNFEKELANWPCFETGDEEPPDAGSVTVGGTFRTKLGQKSRYPSTRLDEILASLASCSSSMMSYIDDAVLRAAGDGSDYTVDCLLRIRDSLGAKEPFKFSHESNACLIRRRAVRKAYENYIPDSAETEKLHSATGFDFLMSIREYSLIPKRLAMGERLGINKDRRIITSELVSGGFAVLLHQVMTPGLLKQLEYPGGETKTRRPDPLLVAACRRDLPNLEVVKVLVEDFKVDVNGQNRWAPGCWQPPGSCETALHALARGTHWWQAAQGIPYLVMHGADMEARDSGGLTPVNAALDRLAGNLDFNRQAVESLVRLGADVNSIDDKGVSCLARASANKDILELLLDYGAAATPKELFSALKRADSAVLEVMLLHGADANGCTPSAEQQLTESYRGRMCHRKSSDLSNDQLYPLHYVATCDESRQDAKSHMRMLRLLLQHGADPNARYADTTVAHQVIENGTFAKMFLELPSLDVEAVNTDGETLLLAACHKAFDQEQDGERHSLPRILLSRGADLSARDSHGRNALHHLLKMDLVLEDPDLLRQVAAEAPSLVNSPDNDGRTPIHLAVNRFTRAVNEIDILLAAGADPWIADSAGNNVLHIACRNGVWRETDAGGEARCAVLGRLLALPGAAECINMRNAKGETPVFGYFQVDRHMPWLGERATGSAADKGSIDAPYAEPAFGVFEAAKVDWGVVNSAGETLLHIVAAARGGDYYTGPKIRAGRFTLLLAKGLDPMAEDAQHRTVLDVAAAFGAREILKIFEKK